MAKSVVKFESDDKKTYNSREEADTRNFYLKLRKLCSTRGNYSLGYDGPMPMSEPTLESVAYYRQRVRHLFLEVPEPEPQIIEHTRIEIQHTFPHWSVPVLLIVFGFLLGAWLF